MNFVLLVVLLYWRVVVGALEYSWDSISYGRYTYNTGKLVSNKNISVVATITTSNKILISFDYGAFWNDLSYVLNIEGKLKDICMDETGRFITAVTSCEYDCYHSNNEGNLYLSENFGRSYRKVTMISEYYWHSVCADVSGQYQAVASSNNGNKLSSGRIYTSLDYGRSWNESIVPGGYSFDWVCLAAYRYNANFIYLIAASDHGLYISSDFGMSWEVIPAAPSYGSWTFLLLFTNSSSSANDVVITGIVGNNTVVFSTDMGVTWKQLVVSNSVPQYTDANSPIERSNITAITASGDGRVITIAGDAGLFTSFDFGVNFLTNTPPSPAPFNISGIVASSSGQIVLAYSTHSVSMYVGNLCKWTEVMIDANNLICSYATPQYSWSVMSTGSYLNEGSYLRSDKSGKYIGYGGCYDCNDDDYVKDIYVSSDYGNTFMYVDGGTFDEFSNFAMSRSGKYWYALNYFKDYVSSYSSNYGKSWTSKYDSKEKCRGVALTNDGTIYIVCDGASGGSLIYKSSDASKSWVEVSKQSDDTFDEIIVDSSGKYVIAIPAFGPAFAYSSNGGKSWTSVRPQPSSNYTSWYGITSSDSGQYVAVIANNSVLCLSHNFGVDWTLVSPAGLDVHTDLSIFLVLTSISMTSDGKYMIACGHGSAVYTSMNYGVDNSWHLQFQHLLKFRPDCTVSVEISNDGLYSSFSYCYIANGEVDLGRRVFSGMVCAEGQGFDGFMCQACTVGSGNVLLNSITGLYSECSVCGPGTYSAVVESNTSTVIRECKSCDVGEYSGSSNASSQTTCQSCPYGRTTASRAGTSQTQCFSPLSNFITGMLSLLFAIVMIAFFLIDNRFQSIAWFRRSTITLPLIRKCRMLYCAIAHHTEVLKLRRQVSQKRKEAKWSKILASCMFLLAACLVMVIGILFVITAYLISMLFSCLILWRGLGKQSPKEFSQIVDAVRSGLDRICEVLKLPPALLYLFDPFLYILKSLSLLDLGISLDKADITCSGSQAPVQLLVGCLVLGFVIVVIQADYGLAWSTVYSNTSVASVKLSLVSGFNDEFKLSTSRKVVIALGAFFTWSFGYFNLYSSLLQYLMGFVVLSPFFASGRHPSDPSCNAYGGASNLDNVMAILTSVIVWILLCPVIYTVASVIVPKLPKWYRPKSDISKVDTTPVHEDKISCAQLCLGLDYWIECLGQSHIYRCYRLLIEDKDEDTKLASTVKASLTRSWSYNYDASVILTKLTENTKSSNDYYRFPTYLQLAKMVHQDMQDHLRNKDCTIDLVNALAYLWSFTILGQLCTNRGFECWLVIITKYYLFLCACLGLWTRDVVEVYDIVDTTHMITKPHSDLTRLQSNVAGVVHAMITIRCVLLQTSAYMTILSVFTIKLSKTPLYFSTKVTSLDLIASFCKSKVLSVETDKSSIARDDMQYLLPWTVENAMTLARSRLVEDLLSKGSTKEDIIPASALTLLSHHDEASGNVTRTDYEWLVQIQSCHIYFAESRSIQLVLNIFKFMAALGFLYGDVRVWLLVSLVVFFVVGIIESLPILVYVGVYFDMKDTKLRHICGLRCCGIGEGQKGFTTDLPQHGAYSIVSDADDSETDQDSQLKW